MTKCTALRSEEFANQTLLFFVLDAGEEFGPQPGDGLRFIERQPLVDFAAREMTRLASCLKDRLDLSCKVRLLCGRGNCRGREVLWLHAQTLRRGVTGSETKSQKQWRNEYSGSHRRHDRTASKNGDPTLPHWEGPAKYGGLPSSEKNAARC
jgi:hypothetical protein